MNQKSLNTDQQPKTKQRWSEYFRLQGSFWINFFSFLSVFLAFLAFPTGLIIMLIGIFNSSVNYVFIGIGVGLLVISLMLFIWPCYFGFWPCQHSAETSIPGP